METGKSAKQTANRRKAGPARDGNQKRKLSWLGQRVDALSKG